MTTITADKIYSHDMQGSVIWVNCCCWTAKVLNAFMLGKILHGDKGNGCKVFCNHTKKKMIHKFGY